MIKYTLNERAFFGCILSEQVASQGNSISRIRVKPGIIGDDIIRPKRKGLLQMHTVTTSCILRKQYIQNQGKFLQAQVKIGLITSKEDKHTHENYLLSINRAHELYDNFRPYKMPKKEDLSSSSSQQQNGGNQDSSKINNTDKLSIEELLKPSKELSPIFKAMEKSVDELYTQKEAGEIAFGYIQVNELDKKIADPRRVLLDPVMTDALFRGLMKKGALYPTNIEKQN